jgi:hypothetical protein
MKLRFTHLIYSFFALLLVLSSCKRPDFDMLASTAWNPNLAVPLAYGTFDVYDIFANSNPQDLVVVDQTNGSIALIYRSDLTVIDGKNLVGLQDITNLVEFSNSNMNIAPSGAFNGTANAVNQHDISVDAGQGVELNSILAKNGQLILNVSTNLAHNVSVLITFPGILIGGSPLQQTLQLDYAGSIPHGATSSVNLTNALMDMTVGNTTVNTLRASVQTTVSGTGQPVLGNENLSLSFNTTNFSFANAIGYFGQQSILDVSDSLLLRIFQNAPGDGYFEFSNPSLRLLASNALGLPIRIVFNSLRTINVVSGQEFELTGYPSVHILNFPAIFGDIAETLILFNTSNTSNLSTVITPVPKFLAFAFGALTNPSGPTSTPNFLSDTSKLRIRSELELPLEGFAYGFGIKDTVPFSLNQQLSQIEYVMFRLIMDNGFPVQLGAQLRFLDQNYSELFSAWDQITELVPPATVNSQGLVNQRGYKITDLVLDDWKLDLLPQVAFIEIEGNTQTYNGPSGLVVKFFDWYNLKMQLSMQIQAKIKI